MFMFSEFVFKVLQTFFGDVYVDPNGLCLVCYITNYNYCTPKRVIINIESGMQCD
ncbi:hypothetical protein C1645_762523, partial [Glomus cerebriforme]